MIRIVHLSDLHFGTETPAVVTALDAAIGALAPELVVVSGDLTQRARRREFAAARRFLAGLDSEVVVVPGNHDIPLYNPMARALWPFRRYREAFGPTGTSLLERGRLRLVAVNSVRPERHASGAIGRRRRRHVAALARAAPAGTIVVVVAHHPLGTEPLPTAIRADAGDRRTSAEWSRAGVHMVMSGHVHRPFLMRAPGVPAGRPLWMLNAGTAISRRLRHEFPNSFNVVDVPDRAEGWTLTVERHDYEGASARFALHERREARL